MKQGQLLNTQTMARSRDMQRRIRARLVKALDLLKSGSQTTAAASSPVQPAAAPAPTPARSRESFQETELSLPCEDRNWKMGKLERCPVCWSTPVLRTTYPSGRFEHKAFYVRCNNTLCKQPPTPPCKTSQEAVCHWQMAVKLAKP